MDTTFLEDERVAGFPEHLTRPTLALVKAEGLRQAADLVLDDISLGGPHEVDVDGCVHCRIAYWLDTRADELEAWAQAAEAAAEPAIDLEAQRAIRRDPWQANTP